MELSGAAVAVTGATGFVGRYLVRVLEQRGARVIALVRDPARAAEQLGVRPGLELRRAELGDRVALEHALAGADALIHNAALISVGRASRAELFAVNATGTRNLCRAAGTSGVRRVVMTSTAHVYRPKRDHLYRVGDPVWEASARGSRFSWYGISKAAAEAEARGLAAEHGLALTIARPHQVYGAFDTGSFTRYFRALMRSPVTVWFTHVRLPSVYAGDLAEALVRMVEAPSTAGTTYNVAGNPDTSSWWQHYRAWRRAGGPPRLVIPIPIPVRRELDIDPVARDLRWHNRSLEQGFEETLALERGEPIAHQPDACGEWTAAPPARKPRVATEAR